MASLMKKTEQYQALPAKISQQVLRGLDRNWQSFFAASSEFKSHPDKFSGIGVAMLAKVAGWQGQQKAVYQATIVHENTAQAAGWGTGSVAELILAAKLQKAGIYPVEHVASLRAIPNLLVMRPGDGTETSGAYKVAVSETKRPTLLALSRQNLPNLAGTSLDGVAKGAYVITDCEGTPDVILCERGIRTFDSKYTRNTLDLSCIPV